MLKNDCFQKSAFYYIIPRKKNQITFELSSRMIDMMLLFTVLEQGIIDGDLHLGRSCT